MGINVNIEISESLKAKLRTLGAIGPAAMNAPLIAGGQLVANAAKDKAPVLTGTLRRSIRVEAVAAGEVVVGTDVPYGRRIEYGFNDTDKRGRRYHQAAQPYLRPAIDETRNQVTREVGRVMQDIVRRILT